MLQSIVVILYMTMKLIQKRGLNNDETTNTGAMRRRDEKKSGKVVSSLFNPLVMYNMTTILCNMHSMHVRKRNIAKRLTLQNIANDRATVRTGRHNHFVVM